MEKRRGIRAVLICGPTASGKSSLALELAKELGGAVINADSMQVYAEPRILTNRPTHAEEAEAPHRLYGFQPMREPYSAALWLKDVTEALGEAESEGLLPILAGGTGLYFKVLTEGLSDIPDIPPEIRKRFRKLSQAEPAETLHAELARRDPATAARLRPSDPQRVIRALEVLEATGRPLSEWQGHRERPLLPLPDIYPIALTMEREELYRRCDARFEAMLAQGAAEEARAIASLGLDPSLPAMRAVGLPPLLAYVRGECSLDEAATAAKTATRNYAKRQLTWIRSNFTSWITYNAQSMERTKGEIDSFIRNRLTGRG
jgi:tRNA dimethylallyltransferase